MPRTNLRDSVKPEMLAPGTRTKIIARNTFQFTAPDGATIEQALRLKIRKFCAKLDGLKELPVPSSGDCWLCRMKDKAGISMGERGGAAYDRSHLLEHSKEGYLHGSLLVNALTHAGYVNPSLVFSLEQRDRQDGRKLHNGGQVKRALKRYLYAKLGLVR